MATTTNIELKNGKTNFLDKLFIAFCLCPYILPNPVVVTNIQPYAALLGSLIIFFELLGNKTLKFKRESAHFFCAAFATLIVAIVALFISSITISSMRALFNYFSVAIVPFALYLIFRRVGVFPETLIKGFIVFWFFVASVQFFIDRSFLTDIIGGVRFSYSYRGVVGLSSEPSFLGIVCFYFLHMVSKFKKNQMIFFAMTLVMGVVYAQSAMGVIFIAAFLIIYLLDVINTKKMLYVWAGTVIGLIVFYNLLNTVLVETRLYQLLSLFMEEGSEGVLSDASAEVRYDSVMDAIRDSFANNLLPLGYTKRIGSGYGGFLCELGFFALPILFCISLAMARSFKKRISQILYFVAITILLFNNTQIGNPLLLFVIATNLFYSPNDMLIKKEGREIAVK